MVPADALVARLERIARGRPRHETDPLAVLLEDQPHGVARSMRLTHIMVFALKLVVALAVFVLAFPDGNHETSFRLVKQRDKDSISKNA